MSAAENLARWREAEQGATEGPWRVGAEGSEGSRVNPNTGDKRTDSRYLVACNGRVQPEDGHNAKFIATAREATPALLAFAEAVLAGHDRRAFDSLRDFVYFGQTEYPDQCAACRVDYPCPTVRLAEQHLGGAS